jgi:hypothetical protein
MLFSANISHSALVNAKSDNSTKFVNFSSTNILPAQDLKYSFMEKENISRFSRFSNPVISYDYKCGNYLGI